jgi:hypothetical protein
MHDLLKTRARCLPPQSSRRAVWLAAGDWGGRVKVWDAATGKHLATPAGGAGWDCVCAPAFTGRDRLCVVTGGDKAPHVSRLGVGR